MLAFSTAIQTIKDQLQGLSSVSKMLIGSLMVILVMGLFIVALYTGRSSMVPLPVSLTGDARTTAIGYLERRSIPWSQRADQLMVPAEQQHVILAELTDREIISPDEIDFDALVQQESPFLSKAQNERRWLVATMNHLSRTIRAMKGIARAEVVIDEPSRPGGIGRAHIAPSASVTVTMERDNLDQEQVNAIAEMVAGAHA